MPNLFLLGAEVWENIIKYRNEIMRILNRLELIGKYFLKIFCLALDRRSDGNKMSSDKKSNFNIGSGLVDVHIAASDELECGLRGQGKVKYKK